MTDSTVDRIALRLVNLERGHAALARARQLPASSVTLVDGSTTSVGGALEQAVDASAGLGVLDGQVADLGGVTDQGADNGSIFPEWATDAAGSGDAGFVAGEIAYSRAREAKAVADQAVADVAVALAESAEALAEAGLARSEAAAAVADAQVALTEAQQAIADALAADTSATAAAAAAAAAQTAAGTAQTAANLAQTTANAKGKTIIQSAAPAAADRLAQNLWIDTTGNANTPKRWTTGTTWVAVTDKTATDAAAAAVAAQTKADQAFADAAAAATAAGNAQTSANGKNTVWYQATEPAGTGHKAADTWFDTANGGRMSRWSGAAWVVQQFGTAAIANLSVTNALIANATIQDAKIATLDAAKITTGLLAAARIEALSITGDKIAGATITAGKLVANTITANEIAANAITTSELAANSVVAVKIATDAVIAAKIQAGAVTTDKLFALAVTAEKIAVGSIIAEKIATGAVTAGKIFADAIDGMTITGATLRTAASGQRVQLDSFGLRTFNPSNAETARLSAAAGGLLLSGSLTSWDGVGGSNRATVSGGGVLLDREAAPGLVELTRAGIRSTQAGIPIRVSHDAAGATSDIELIVDPNNAIRLGGKLDLSGTVLSGSLTVTPGITGSRSTLTKDVQTGWVECDLWVEMAAGINAGTGQVLGTIPSAFMPLGTYVFSVNGFNAVGQGVQAPAAVRTTGQLRLENGAIRVIMGVFKWRAAPGW